MLEIKKDISLSQYTTFKIGGPAQFFAAVKNINELKEALDYAKNNNLPFFILGGGSNVLASDKGYEGLVIKMESQKITVDKAQMVISAEAGCQLSKIINESVANNLSGLEWAAGIPGTLGGAIRGNAGAYGGEMSGIVLEVKALNKDTLETKIFNQAECNFSYRQSVFKEDNQFIILSASLKLKSGDKAKSQARIKEIIQERSIKQPKGLGSAGSFFVNPVVEQIDLIKEFEKEKGIRNKNGKLPAGWLIEKAGLKGKKIGSAMISDVHPNYFVNTGRAKADEIEILVSLVKQQVRDKFGVELQEEVEYLG